MRTEDRKLAALASLNEPLRRRLYRYVAGHETAVSRDEAAAGLGVARSVAAFHLDKLADLGLLEFEYRRPIGRTGPGAGRPAKLYRRTAGEVSISVPERHYDLAARLLAQAVDDASDGSVSVANALGAAAREHGRAIGVQLDRSEPRSVRLIEQIAGLLTEQGYEPQVVGGTMTLVNCPFHSLAQEHRELVCGMNHELIKGVVEAAGLPDDAARLDPGAGRCCVTLVA